MVREAPRLRSSELEAVHPGATDFQHRALLIWVPSPVVAAVDAFQSEGPRHAFSKHYLQHGYFLQHEHRYSALLRGSVLFEFQPDLFLLADVLSVGSHRSVRSDGDHPRIPERFAPRQLLRRYVAGGYLPVSSGRIASEHRVSDPGHADDLSKRLPGQHARARRNGH